MTNPSCLAARLARPTTVRIARLVQFVEASVSRFCLTHPGLRDQVVFANYLWRPLDIQLTLDGGELEDFQSKPSYLELGQVP